MTAKSKFRVAGLCVVACCGVLAAGAAGAFGQATTGSAAGLIIPKPPNQFFLPPPNPPMPGYTVVGDCPTFLFNDGVNFEFTDGSFVVYGPPSGFSGGHNVQGDAMLLDNGVASGYAGHTHIWDNSNSNPTGNPQTYDGTTISTHLSDGTNSIQINGAFGGTTSASGHQSGWFHLKVTCS